MAQRNEAPALELLDEHRQVPREVFAAHGSGEVEAVGDGFFVEFSSALDGVRCAIETQERLASRNRAGRTHRRIRVRGSASTSATSSPRRARALPA